MSFDKKTRKIYPGGIHLGKKLKTYSVPITITVSGHIDVQATSKKDALSKVGQVYADQWKDDSHHGLKYPCVDVDFAEEEDQVECNEEEEI